jgi:hypothetical protein
VTELGKLHFEFFDDAYAGVPFTFGLLAGK